MATVQANRSPMERFKINTYDFRLTLCCRIALKIEMMKMMVMMKAIEAKGSASQP